MNFLIDECPRPLVADGLRNAGHDAIHVGDAGLLGATDEHVMSLAVAQARIVVSADTDFGELLARATEFNISTQRFCGVTVDYTM